MCDCKAWASFNHCAVCIITVAVAIIHPVHTTSKIPAHAEPLEKGVTKEGVEAQELEGHFKVTQWVADPEPESTSAWQQTTALPASGEKAVPTGATEDPVWVIWQLQGLTRPFFLLAETGAQ